MASLQLVPIFCGQQAGLVAPLGARLAALLGLEVVVHEATFDAEVAFDVDRGQYNTRVLLARLLQHADPKAQRLLGLTAVDLFIPVLTFVFGEAELGGRAAIVSTFRLENELYGLPPDPALCFERLVKESVHELGHLFGLVHCQRSSCVMASSNYVEGIDLKAASYCDRCLGQVRRQLGGR
ncbi:MAG: archaemetzincin family Zn-dependent metalloprotease [Planctomycetes bacterium]|nr:archaemetzincin family Zn-dependent metalloprotease [Planctomycetota bacterium]MCC7398927.1 archaemetzincin family Zn-dependent metalloprotease [Planctomycetota bacterium]